MPPDNPNTRQHQPLLRGVLLSAVLVATFALAAFPIHNCDLWHHMKMGEYVLTHRHVPLDDLFSFASTRPWVNPAWLSGVLFHWLWEAGGPAALIALKAGLAAAIVGVLWRIALREGASPFIAALTAIGMVYSMRARLICRPLIFTTLFLSVAIYLLRDFAGGRRSRLWLMPVLCLVWANLHAGFFAAFVLLPLYLLETVRGREEPGKRMSGVKAIVVCGILCLIATLVSPFGLRALIHPFTLTSSSHLGLTAEWLPMSLKWQWFRPGSAAFMYDFAFFWIGLALLLVSTACTFRQLRISDGLTILVFTAMALSSRRHVDLFAVATFPILAKHLTLASPTLRRRLTTKPSVVAASYVLLAASVVVVGFFLRFGDDNRHFGFGVRANSYPSKAADFVQANGIPGRMMNNWPWGSYLIWRLYPTTKVFADGRFEVYDEEVFTDWRIMAEGRPGWEDVAARHDINFAVIGLSLKHAAAFQSDRWKLIYWDDVSVVFVRNTAANRALIDKHECGLTHPVFFHRNITDPAKVPLMEAQLRAKIAADPTCVKAHGNLAKLLFRTGRLTEAASEFKRVTVLQPWSPPAYHDLGACCMRLDRLDDAIRAFGALVRMRALSVSRRGLAHLRLGDCWRQKGDSAQAARHYQRALRLMPGNEAAQAGLGATGLPRH